MTDVCTPPRAKVVVVNGTPLSGKDLFCENIILTTPKADVVSTVDRIKIAARVLGWDGKKSEEARLFLHELKMLSSKYNDGPLQYVMKRVEETRTKGIKYILIHCREPEEIQKIKDTYPDTITVLIKRHKEEYNWNNEGDSGVFDYCYDVVISNDADKEQFLRETIRFVYHYLLEL